MDPKKKRPFDAQSFAWGLHERPQPRKSRVLRPDVVALRAANLDEKDALLAIDEAKFFGESHYNGYPVITARLEVVNVGELAELMTDAGRLLAPGSLVRDRDAREPPSK